MTIRGTCLGWSIVSDHHFHFLREGTGGKTLEVREWDPGVDPAIDGELLVRWRPRPDRPFHGSVHRIGNGALVIDTSDAGWFRLWPDSDKIDMARGVQPVAREVRLLTTPMLLLSTMRGLTPLHASCVDIGGRAVAISAPGGFGKTTLAAALVGRGHGLLAEDITVLNPSRNVLPGPDLLRLRLDTAPVVAANARLQVVHRSGDRIMVRTGTPQTDPVPLVAVVLLKTSCERTLAERSDPGRLADLWQVGFHLPNLTDRKRAFAALTALADTTPIYDLARPLTWDSLEWSMDTIERLAR